MPRHFNLPKDAEPDDIAKSRKPDFQPLYAQIKSLITRRIGDGTWKPGDLLPTEYELASEYGVSQGTARKALIALEGEKLIVRRQGVGTFVARHARDTALFHFFRMVEADGTPLKPRSRILRQSVRPATQAQAKQLDIERGAALHAVTRLRLLQDVSAIHEEICTPVALVPVLTLPKDVDMPEEMYVIYQERYNILVSRVAERLRAVAADAKVAKTLHVPEGTPLLEIVRVAYDATSRPVELRISRCDTSRTRYAADIT